MTSLHGSWDKAMHDRNKNAKSGRSKTQWIEICGIPPFAKNAKDGAPSGYHIRAHPHQRVSYRADEIDLPVAYIVPEDIWYVFPPSAFKTMKSLRLFPQHKQKTSKFERYREAWHAFQEVKGQKNQGATKEQPRSNPGR